MATGVIDTVGDSFGKRFESALEEVQDIELATKALRTMIAERKIARDQVKHFGDREKLEDLLDLLGVEFADEDTLRFMGDGKEIITLFEDWAQAFTEKDDVESIKGYGLNTEALAGIFNEVDDGDDAAWFLID